MKNELRWKIAVGLCAAALLSPVALAGCNCSEETGDEGDDIAETEGEAELDLSRFAALEAPTDLNMDKVVLGRRLYHDTALSGDQTLSCASCHVVAEGGAEHRVTSQGIRAQSGPINAPTVLNAGLAFRQFWDGRAADLKEQAAGPVTNPIEMGAEWPQVIERVSADEWYTPRFASLYEGQVTQDSITDAIAEYERSLITPGRFDRFLGGEDSALTAEEQAGLRVFVETGCPTCHNGVLLGGNTYQRMGLVRNYFEQRGGELTEADNGRFNVTQNEEDRHKFKVPTLRNVSRTAPYFHDGSQQELAGAVRIMASVQLGRDLEDAQVQSIVAFLRALDGDLPEHALIPDGEMPHREAVEAAEAAEGEGAEGEAAEGDAAEGDGAEETSED